MPNWNQILTEIMGSGGPGKSPDFDGVRRAYLAKLHVLTHRNTICYYSGWLSKDYIQSMGINDEDKNGFMSAIYGLDTSVGLDLIIHTPGGSIAATQSIVYYLQKKFGKDIRAFIPQIAMSAGTMLACSCKEIVMGHHSNLGPIDPLLRDIPAQGIRREFRTAYKEMTKDPNTLRVWRPILEQYRPTFLNQCENAVKWSNEFVREQLASVMFDGDPQAKEKARRIVRKLSDFQGNKSHERHIHADECRDIGLPITQLEDHPDLQEAVLSVHHAYMVTLANTPAYKFIENHMGSAQVKNVNRPKSVPLLIPQPIQKPK